MKKVYLAKDPVNAELLKEVLEDADIQASVQDERTFALWGETAVAYPTVWVLDEDYDAARAAVAEFERSQKSPPESATWTCPKCGEQVEGHFEECWKCDAQGQLEQVGESAEPQQGEHLLAAVHPRALRTCASCRRLAGRCAWGMFFIGVGMLAGRVAERMLCLAFAPRSLGWFTSISHSAFFFASLALLSVFFLGVGIPTFVRFVIIAFFFTRYSLAQLMCVVLSTGACGTGIAALPGAWKIFPSLGLAILVIVVLAFIAAQDPEGPVYVPAFLRRALAKKETQAGREISAEKDN